MPSSSEPARRFGEQEKDGADKSRPAASPALVAFLTDLLFSPEASGLSQVYGATTNNMVLHLSYHVAM